ncbi:MAG: SUKH-3 domain-containing protein [Oscillospiraceae bacterium]
MSDVSLIDKKSNTNIIHKFLEKYGGTQYYNIITDIQYTFFKDIEYIYIDNKNVSTIGVVGNDATDFFHLTISSKGEIYIYELKQKISTIDDFFKTISSNSLDIVADINPKTYDVLKSMGWYEYRNIDISNLIDGITDENIELFPKALEFYQEFYNLKDFIYIEDNLQYKIHTLSRYEILRLIHHQNKIDYFPIFYVDYPNGIYYYNIYENGRIYNIDGSFIGSNPIEAFNTILKKFYL